MSAASSTRKASKLNILLLEPDDFVDGSARVRVGGRRLQHLQTVLRSKVGDTIRVGLLHGLLGSALVTSLEPEAVEMSVSLEHSPPPSLPVTLLLALPRPKVLRRLLASITSLGVKTIYLIHSYRVEKSYWQSPFLSSESLRQQLHLGLEQGVDTAMPKVYLRRRFKPFVEDELPGLLEGTLPLVAHPGQKTLRSLPGDQRFTLAIGPDGGFIPYEVEKLQEAGFEAFGLGPRILKVETAVSVALSRFL